MRRVQHRADRANKTQAVARLRAKLRNVEDRIRKGGPDPALERERLKLLHQLQSTDGWSTDHAGPGYVG